MTNPSKKALAKVKPDSRYLNHDDFSEIVVMAVAGNYVMARHPHCIPFVISVKQLLDDFFPKP